MLKQINILLDPLGNGGGGSTAIAQSTNGGVLQGTLTEGDSDNVDDSGDSGDNDNSSSKDIFDVSQFTSDGKSSTSDSVDNNEKPVDKVVAKKSVGKTEEVIGEDKTEESEEVVEGEEDNSQQINKQQQTNKSTIDKRDYTGFNKEDIEYLKKLPNGVFNHVAPVLKKLYNEQNNYKTTNEELKKFRDNPNRIPDNWYEHKDAYTLSPKFQELSGNYSKADYESNHWQEQLVNLKTHKAYIPIMGYDSKTGEYKFGDPIRDLDDTSIAKLEIQMQQAINKANIMKQSLNGEAEKLKNEFSSNYNNLNGYYDKVDEMVKLLPTQYHPREEHLKKFESALHPAHRGTGIAKAFAKVYSIMLNQGAALAEYAKKGEVSLKNNLDNKAAGPKSSKTVTSTSGKSSKGGVKTFDGDEEVDLEKLKRDMEN